MEIAKSTKLNSVMKYASCFPFIFYVNTIFLDILNKKIFHTDFSLGMFKIVK